MEYNNLVFPSEQNCGAHLHITGKTDLISVVTVFNNQQSCVGWNGTKIIRNHRNQYRVTEVGCKMNNKASSFCGQSLVCNDHFSGHDNTHRVAVNNSVV